ncbi:uncharacterized protein LOC126900121 [Daktulosphaira vitifoliae]|uniref:uncharacterized protein LOC126900121 n=1 Tax=Daktulosphaira vitifoliae TaxID=58002 RepID=UPI0021AB07ED|nr:uncharacterized protein LOC126900121 [Daktulosphaira vitifoliae]
MPSTVIFVILLVFIQGSEKVLTISDDTPNLPSSSSQDESVPMLIDSEIIDTCPICLDDMKKRQDITLVDECCRKSYHASCLNTWKEKSNTCPSCRGSLNQICSLCNAKTKLTTRLFCCGRIYCDKCLYYSYRKTCPCGSDIAKGIPYDGFRKCSDCTNVGVRSFSHRCPHTYCEECFNKMSNSPMNACLHCGEKEL